MKPQKPIDYLLLEQSVADEYPAEKYKVFCQAIKECEISIFYLKSKEGQDEVGSEVAKEKIASLERSIRRLKGEKQSLREYLK